MLVNFPLSKKQYPIASLGFGAVVTSIVLLGLGLHIGHGVMVKLGCYTLGFSIACGLWLLTDRYVVKNSAQLILRLAAVVDGGLAVQMNLSYVLWALELPKGTTHLYHSIMADYFWAGPAMLVFAAFFYVVFKASINTESYAM